MAYYAYSEKRLLKEIPAAKLSAQLATRRSRCRAGKGRRFLKVCGAVRYEPANLDVSIEATRRLSTSDPGGSESMARDGASYDY
jgi:hypothetical protein